MIVWSKGLGKQRLLVELASTEMSVEPEHVVMKGVIESVSWRYAIRLSPKDMADFLTHMRQPEAARFLAQHGGLLLPLAGGLLVQLPRLLWLIVKHKIFRVPTDGGDDALLV